MQMPTSPISPLMVPSRQNYVCALQLSLPHDPAHLLIVLLSYFVQLSIGQIWPLVYVFCFSFPRTLGLVGQKSLMEIEDNKRHDRWTGPL